MTANPGERTRLGWKVNDSTFGARLALVRQRMDWNVKQAAAECGIPAATWRTWERDNVLPRHIVEMTLLIAGRTGCDRMWLLLGPEGATNSSEATVTEVRRGPYAGVSRPPGRPGGIRTAPVRPPVAAIAA